MPRRDGRTARELRPLVISHAVLSRADGSAKFSFGNVSVLASVSGPAEVRIRDELVDRAKLEINVLPLRGLPGPATKAQETTLQSLLAPLLLLHLYPRSLIQLTLQTVSSPTTAFSRPLFTDPSSSTATDRPLQNLPLGMALAAAHINAATLALLDASVESRGLVLAVAVAFLLLHGERDEEVELVLDPTPEEEERASSVHLFAFSFGVGVGDADGECVVIDSVGQFSENQLFDAQELANDAARGLVAFVRKSVETRYGAQPSIAPPQNTSAPEEEKMKMEYD